uniref:Senescence regulator n=1 Tax=Kalanchoe fedtschenkoi TaxID=63787 RepID=A0A7N0UCS8_KALFE
MAKGRKLTASRSERLLGSYTDYVHTQTMTPTSTEPSDLEEEDIWSMVDDSVDRRRSEWVPRPQAIEISGSTRRRSAAEHYTHHNGRRHHVGGLSLAFEDSSKTTKTAPSRIVHQIRANGSTGSGQMKRGVPFMAASAPLNVPDWSKIYRVDSVESIHDSDGWLGEEFESEMIPPHEYLARSRNKAATSVFEGVGRTLKGRDLSRVRDAVWSQTGFDG